jgi:hypothetical protein
MKIIFIFLFYVIFSSLVYSEAQNCPERDEEFVNRSSASDNFWKLLEGTTLLDNYQLDICRVNPWYLNGDFDANGYYDYSIILKPRSGKDEIKLAVIWDSGKVDILERDDKLQYPTIDAWHIFSKNETVLLGAEEGTPPILIGDGIMIYKLESSSSLVYWNGTRFTYYWQGD